MELNSDAISQAKIRLRDKSKTYLTDDPTNTLYNQEVDETGHPVGRVYSAGTYTNYKCRCPGCKKAMSEYQKGYKLRRKAGTKEAYEIEIVELRAQLAESESEVLKLRSSIENMIENSADVELIEILKYWSDTFDLAADVCDWVGVPWQEVKLDSLTDTV